MIKIIYFDSPKRNSGGCWRDASPSPHITPRITLFKKKSFVAGATHFATFADRALPENKEKQN
jgi:hypothetical protein